MALTPPVLRTDRYRVSIFLQPKPGISAEEFHDHWLNVHGPLFAKMPLVQQNVLKYEQLHVDNKFKPPPTTTTPASPAWGMVIVEAATLDKVFELYHDSYYLDLVVPDERKFMDQTKTQIVAGQFATVIPDREPAPPSDPEHPVIRPNRARVCWLIRPKPGVSFEEFDEYWLSTHSRVFAGTKIAQANLTKYEQAHVDPSYHSPVAAPILDAFPSDVRGIVILESTTLERIFEIFETEEYLSVVYPDEQKFVDHEFSRFMAGAYATVINK